MQRIIVTLIILATGLVAPTGAVEFAGGTGEPHDPYQIATAEQLMGISSDPNLFDKHFVLTADIDLDPNLPGRRIFTQAVVEWVRVGARPTRLAAGDLVASAYSGTGLSGSFDGDGHVIRNCMLVNTNGTRHAGFFAEIASSGVVRNLRIEDMVVSDLRSSSPIDFYPGCLAAINGGTVIGCSATGWLSLNTGGGLIGRNAGLVVGCRATCDIFGFSIGGLIGLNEASGRVVLCESDGILYTESFAGGLAIGNFGTIQYCQVGGFISGGQAGGLVGENGGTVRECFVTASLGYGGGIAYENSGTIANCYATGPISGTRPDGLVLMNRGMIQSSYSTTATQRRSAATRSVRSSGPDGDGSIAILAEGLVQYVYCLDPNKPGEQTDSPFLGYGVALSPAQMTRAASFIGFDFCGDANDGLADPWFMPPEGYPVLTWQTEITGLAAVPDVWSLSLEQAEVVLQWAGLEPDGVRYDYARSRATASRGPAQPADTRGLVITTSPAGNLSPGSPVAVIVSLGSYSFSENAGDGSQKNPYRIETAGQLDALYGQSTLWDSHFELAADIDLSGYVHTGSLIAEFSGTFNGNGHAIRNLQTGKGLFGTVDANGLVHDLIVDQASLSQVPGSLGAGVLAGMNKGLVLRCQVLGHVLGTYSETGGLVGCNLGQLVDCRFSGRVQSSEGSQYVGGLAGRNAGSISGCCVPDVEVFGGAGVGGLVGQSGSTTALIEACYATGVVQGHISVGGLVGEQGTSSHGRATRTVLVQDPIAIAGESSLGGVIRHCYAACLMTGQHNVGGCIGLVSDPNTTLDSCFFLSPESGGGPDNGLGAPLTTEQMRQQASFPGLDFDAVWTICEGRDYPRLRWEDVQCEGGL